MAKKLKTSSLLELSFVSDPQLSPDASQAAVVHTFIEEGKDDNPPAYKSKIVLYDTNSGESRDFTSLLHSSHSPRFSPDGSRLAFLSARGEHKKPQLFVMSLAGGEAQQMTEFKSGVGQLVWHPDGQQLAFTSQGDYEDKRKEKGEPRSFEHKIYKADYVGLVDETAAQVYLLDVASNKSKKLTKLEVSISGLVFSPDGSVLYFTGAKSAKQRDALDTGIWRLSLKNHRIKRIAKEIKVAFGVRPSPDGQLLVYFAPIDSEAGHRLSPYGLWLLSADGGQPQLLTGATEALPSAGGDSRYGNYDSSACWSADSEKVFVVVNEHGRSGLAEVDVKSQHLRKLQSEDRAVTAFDYQHEQFVFVAESQQHPGELFSLSKVGERRLSRVHDDFVAKYELQASSHQQARAKAGPMLDYWQLNPSKARKDNALILQVHGGPHTNYGYGFYLEFHILAAKGYSVVYGNPRGSTSYGTDFAYAMLGAYGTVDADDVLAIGRTARSRHADPEAPIHLTGGSYGGFMTNWLIGHTTEFRSAVSQRSISNWLSFYGTSDIGYFFSQWEVKGNPWEDTDKLWEQSPLRYVANVSTPTLLIHSENDFRCPIEQAEQFYIALKQLGKAPTKLLRFPAEGHELSRSGRPDRRIARLEAMIDWFEQYP